MAVASYDPFALMNQFQHDVNRLFGVRARSGRGERRNGASAAWLPPADVQEEAGQYLITMDVPGVDPKDIEVTMEKGVLSLRGTREVPGPETENSAYARRERPCGGFERRFVLPESADAEGVTAHGKNGVLQVVIPKRRKPQPRRIQVEG